MGKHNLDEGKDELIRAILLMKYDTKKTLTENQEKIKPLIKEDVPGVTAASGAIGAGVGAGSMALGAGTLAGGSVGTTAMAVGTMLGAAEGGGAALILGGSVLGAAASLAVVPLVYWLVTKDIGSNRVKSYFDFCSSSADKVAKLKRKLSDGEIRDIADKINDAVNYSTLGFMAGTDEESLFSAFKSIATGTASDVCALLQYYNRQYGDLWDDLDSDIDSESEWNQIYRPIRNCVEDSMKELEDAPKKQCPTDKPYLNVKTNECESQLCGGCVLLICPDGNPIPADGKCSGKPNPLPSPSTWRECTDFPLTRGCKGKLVSDIQNCIGATVDGKFGPQTERKLTDAGHPTSVTKEVYDKIINNCGKGNEDTSVEDDWQNEEPETGDKISSSDYIASNDSGSEDNVEG
jgi:hypothetical protein